VEHTTDSRAALLAESEAGIAWMSGATRWVHMAIPALFAALGVECVAIANAASRQTGANTQMMWWIGVLSIFVPAAIALLFAKVSRIEAVSILLTVGIALYLVKILFAPGMMWGYDELLHYRTLDSILRGHHLFTTNSLLRVSPFYPGLEAVTAVIIQITGLSPIQAEALVIAATRLLTVTSLFLIFERLASPSRLAAVATLLYMACPSFLYFDAMYAYESLALPLAFACIFALRAAQREDGRLRRTLNGAGALLLLAVVVTHHVTSFILVGTLVAWSIAEFVRDTRRESKQEIGQESSGGSIRWRARLRNLPGNGWVPLLGIVAVVGWLTTVAEITVAYLLPQLMSGVAELIRIIRREGTSRKLFESTGGHGAPMLERVVGIGSVLAILMLILLGMLYLRKRRPLSVLGALFTFGSLAYPATLALRFTKSGWQVGARLTAFIYAPLAFVMSAGIASFSTRKTRFPRLNGLLVTSVVALIFAGGIIAGTSPITRQPAPYDPGITSVPYDTESFAAASWVAKTLPSEGRFAADSAEGALIGSVGRQWQLSSEDSVSVSALLLAPAISDRERTIIRQGRIEYVLADQRIIGSSPLKGFIYEKWERMEYDYGSSVGSETVNKFDSVHEASRVFDSGNIQIFSLSRLLP